MLRFIAIVLTCLFCACAWGAGAPVVVFDNASPPTMYEGKDGRAAGIYPAIVRRAFERMGVPVDIAAEPFRRMMADLQKGTSGAGALIRTEEREAYGDYSAPFFTEELALYGQSARKLRFGTFADLAGRKIGVIRGWAYGKDFDEARAAGLFEAEEVESDDQNFEKLKLGRLDLIVATRLAGEILAADRRYAGIAAIEFPRNANTIHLVFNKKQGCADLLKRFDAAIRDMQTDGEIEAIVQAELTRATGYMGLRSGRTR